MRPLPLANPPNPWASTDVHYLDGEAPHVDLHVYEDHTRQILSKNDSPDVGFTWSINPYRGCFHACAYCLDGETPILMGDGSTRALRDLRVGDTLYGTTFDGQSRRYTRTQVRAHWQTIKPAHRIRLADGTELIASADHRFLTDDGWKYVVGAEHGPMRRPHLTTGDELLGIGAFFATPPVSIDYRRGYLTGVIRGEGLSKTHRYEREGRGHGDPRPFQVTLVDLEPLRRTREYLEAIDVTIGDELVFQQAAGARKRRVAIRTHQRRSVEKIRRETAWPLDPSLEWSRGFLAGIFDAEGSFGSNVLRIASTEPAILRQTLRSLEAWGFDAVLEPPDPPDPRGSPGPDSAASRVRVRGGLGEHLRFFHTVDPGIARKRDIEGTAIETAAALRVTAIEALGCDLVMYDITTGTGDFIANGVVSHNCYARPGHEYLSFGAGTDFERKIVVKPNAPELLREAFDRPSWKGELLVFSGVTDCYQPLEASYQLTRGCLEVCAEYKNPVALITKSPLIERDIDVLGRVAQVTDVGVAVSIPFWDPEKARAMEPYVATPARRMRIIERLARSGIRVSVNVAPVIPGLGDEEIGDVLKAARDAGATSAGWVMLRLPGPVAAVFEERLRAALPLRAEKVLRRVREMRGGKLYRSTFHERGRGEGNYAQMIATLFERTARRLGLSTSHWSEDMRRGAGSTPPPTSPASKFSTTFERPLGKGPQLPLF
ncbi:radical SAM protein [Pendulispora albinea]|uniref:radical SAM protein n=1 Tax=Pendulispora albinea TaxID=2741071 RepID=UPI00374E1C21